MKKEEKGEKESQEDAGALFPFLLPRVTTEIYVPQEVPCKQQSLAPEED